MGKINKRNIKTSLINSNSTNQKHTTIKKTNDGIMNTSTSVAKDKSKLLLNNKITPKKIISKKEKFRQRRKNLLNKFNIIKKQQKEERARKSREKTAIIGDLKPLKDALPSLDDIFKLSKEKEQLRTGVKEFDAITETKNLSPKPKLKKKKENFIKQVKSFQEILKDPEFKRNPREAIRYHIQYTHGLIDE